MDGERPSPTSYAVVAVLALGPAWFFGMSPATSLLFGAGCVATRAARRPRWLHQGLRVAAATVFLSFAELTFTVAFPPLWRIVFYGVMTGTAVALYEWTVPD